METYHVLRCLDRATSELFLCAASGLVGLSSFRLDLLEGSLVEGDLDNMTKSRTTDRDGRQDHLGAHLHTHAHTWKHP